MVSHAVEKQKPGYGTGNKSTAVYVFCSFLSFSETGVGEARLKEANVRWEWAEVTRGLDNLQQVEANFQGKGFLFRSQLQTQASEAIRAVGVALPPTLSELQ